MAAVHAGVKPIWSSEIEKFPLAVTRKRFPDTKQLGDVTKITDVEPVDIVCAGSPCQDLSIAGKREGLAGERSGLFFNAINIVRQLRMSTGGKQPRFFVWENVPGAFTSGSERGADFRAVLESIAETDIPMPKDGRWATAGMVQCPKCEIAWRVLDAQFWGVPQRRKRIFLVADFAATDRRAGKILFIEPSLSGNTEQSRETRKRVASTIEKSIRTASEDVNLEHQNAQVVFSFDSLSSNSMKSANPHSGCRQVEIAKCLDTTVPEPSKNQGGIAIVCKPKEVEYAITAKHYKNRNAALRDRERINAMREKTVGALLRRDYKGIGNQVPILTENITSFVIMGHDERSARFHTETTDPLTACDYKQPQIVAQVSTGGVQMAVDVRNSKEADINGALQSRASNNVQSNNVVRQQYAVRRLTPLECERLQGLPDGWTLINDKSCSDSARYKAIGNGMAQPCADYVIQRIVDEVGKT